MSRNSSFGDVSSLLGSPEGRKEILRKIKTTTEALQDSVGDSAIQTLESCMEETDAISSNTTLEEKLNHQDEILLDSEVMSMSSKVLKQCTRKLTKHVSGYCPNEFAEKLKQYVTDLSNVEEESLDWSLLETEAIKCFNVTPSYSILLGTLAPLEKKEIVKKARTIREAQARTEKPENVVAVAKEEESLERTVQMRKFIKRYYKTYRKPLDLFKMVLDPTDFGKTVENILQISFLIRDGKVRITKDDSGIPVVQPTTEDMIARAKANKTPNTQNVLSLNMEQWECLKSVYRLEKPMIDSDSGR